MPEPDGALRQLLRASDRFKFILNVSLINQKDSADFSRILAVVSHTDEFDRHEEGSIFLIKQSGLDIERVFPVSDSFSISIAQVRRETLDLTSTLDQPRNGWKITLSSGLDDPVLLYTHDVQGLKDVVAECKRLKELSDTTTASSQTYSWLVPYMSHDSLYPILSSTPTDLRLVHSPLHSRLTKARPGLLETDSEDLLLIRDEWLKLNLRQQGTKGRRRISIRIGTFNVNGKLASQDLSPWLRGQGQKLDPLTPADKEPSSPLDDFKASLFLSDKLERELSIADAPSSSPFSTNSTSSTRAVPPASAFVSSNPSNFTLASNDHSTASRNSSVQPTETPVPLDVTSPEDPDLIVLGFQELDLSAEALLYSTSTAREDAWCMAVFAALGEKVLLYEKLISKQLVGMLLVIIVKRSIRTCFTTPQTTAIGAGIMGVMGNKGATAIRLTLKPPPDDETLSPGPTILTFVNAHLSAFDEMAQKRNSDFHDLSKRMLLDPLPGLDDFAQQTSTFEKLNVYQSDVLFWLGDLNYRIDLPDQDVRGILHSPYWDRKLQLLQRYDQLNTAMRTKKAFDIFREAPIVRFPTYRFSPGLLKDELGYDLKRKPAWTDRILHLYNPYTAQVQQHTYTGHMDITMSDHRPVSADFTVDVDVYDHAECEELARKLYRKIDGIEDSLERPRLKLDTLTVDFGEVFFKQAKTRKVILRNNGRVACGYRLVATEGQDMTHPEWLHIAPMTGILLPDEVIDLTLTAFFDNEFAARMNASSNSLDHTLILHTLMGKDHFISVTGQFQYTCFANSLHRLTRLPGAIRSLKSHNDLLPEGRSINAPREIMRLVNWFMTTKQNTNAVFLEHADQNLVSIIRECLDTGADFPFSSASDDPKIPIAFGDTLIQLLESLVEPIIPVTTQARCVLATSRDEAFELLDEFPPASVNVWISVTAFLHYISQSASDPTVQAKKIASILAPVLLREDFESPDPPVSSLGKQAFLLYFIDSEH